ncbi:AraC family transcriptional regulator [Sutterella sp.]|uniref:AraC family transcriptional regulator n=1 Tax=Sutterella sp. TaxID=1981025 RepID=UPI0026DFC8D2|nr:AraC family transcriptional regulator [Sutterella sp.]MDO5532536.1 AraC family transcriptional regulator [Sutterella sp.]
MTERTAAAVMARCRLAGGAAGFNATPVPGLAVVVRTRAGEQRSFQKPYVALALQGRKRTVVGTTEHVYGTGDVVTTCIDFPSFTTVEEASPERPFIAAVLELNRDLMTELALTLAPGRPASEPPGQPFFVSPATEAIADVFLRLLELTERPAEIPVLAPILVRELHARLLLGPQGEWLRSICAYGSHASQIARAVSLIKSDFRGQLVVADLAGRVGLSEASFHRHFKQITGHSPIQYQKLMRLYEGRSLLRSGRRSVSAAAFEVGYASASQFTNDYRRFFGLSPREDARNGFAAAA